MLLRQAANPLTPHRLEPRTFSLEMLEPSAFGIMRTRNLLIDLMADFGSAIGPLTLTRGRAESFR
jgi:hypothetical protein